MARESRPASDLVIDQAKRREVRITGVADHNMLVHQILSPQNAFTFLQTVLIDDVLANPEFFKVDESSGC